VFSLILGNSVHLIVP